ncbi:DUF6069 family protein [Nonomuraea sp. SYSU D8015]|uniref:DUF6069 family protein n=1 Tax=Nonomuraea sp. SYSU D8015 TaxID=2593644 RepID=UPI001CB6EC33|nr:DUF6069 family protein [Nonomuraea sp. SYSU D8015]
MTTFATPPAIQRRIARMLTVLATVLAALIVWAIAVFVTDVNLTGSRWATPESVVVVSGLAGLAGWAALAALEHWTPQAARIWTLLAIGVFLYSLAGPLAMGTSSAQVAIVVLHVTLAAILIYGLRRTADTYSPRR